MKYLGAYPRNFSLRRQWSKEATLPFLAAPVLFLLALATVTSLPSAASAEISKISPGFDGTPDIDIDPTLSRFRVPLPQSDESFVDGLMRIMDDFIDSHGDGDRGDASTSVPEETEPGRTLPVVDFAPPLQLHDLPTPIAQLLLDLSDPALTEAVTDTLVHDRFSTRRNLQRFFQDNLDVYEAYVVQHWKLKRRYPGSAFDAHVWFDRFRDTLYHVEKARPPDYLEIVRRALMGEDDDDVVVAKMVEVLATGPVQERLRMLDGLANNAGVRDWIENYANLAARDKSLNPPMFPIGKKLNSGGK